MLDPMTYQEAVQGAERCLSAGKVGKADIFITRFRGVRFVVKDFGNQRAWLRNSIGRLLISREHRAYRGLSGIPGIPAVSHRLTPFCIAVEYLAGKTFSSVERHEITPATLRQLETIVRDLHARGWVHLDLHRRKNLLLVKGTVVVIDLASAVHTGAVPIVGKLLTRTAGLTDRLALVKFKALFAPKLLTRWERRFCRIRNVFLRTPWEEQTTVIRKERVLPPLPGDSRRGEGMDATTHPSRKP